MTLGLPPGTTLLFTVRPIEPPDHDRRCPRCDRSIHAYDDHATGCLNWGMLPEHWRTT